MKKILALGLTGMLLTCGTVTAASANASAQPAPAPQAEVSETATQTNKLYLVPGTYPSGGQKVKNAITAAGATALTDAECEEIFTENAYLCTLSEGDTLPVPASTRTDKDGKAYSFNGWWTIIDATVTYFDKVPALSETTFLYADWRADLSQRKDPVIPEAGETVEPSHYIMIKRTGASESLRVTLHKAFTSMMNAETLGYLYPVELYVEGLELQPGDVITVYTTGLKDGDSAVISPVLDANNSREIQLEKSGDKPVDTADYFTADEGSLRRNPKLTYIAEEAGSFKLYIKYFSKGSTMAVYMEPMAV